MFAQLAHEAQDQSIPKSQVANNSMGTPPVARAR